MERYMTNTKDVQTTDRMIEGLLLAMIEEGPKAVKEPDDYEARANIMWAGMMAHNNSCGVGRSQDWISHDVEHELSALYDCAHGAGLAVTFPAYLSLAYKHDVARVAQFARRVWGCPEDIDDEEAALMGIESLRQFFKDIGMPSTIGELGGSEADIDKLAHTACYGNGRTGKLCGFVELDEEQIKQVYRNML
jgi:alcohol dehydrogenase YqhD (iron-dependent ADH family)